MCRLPLLFLAASAFAATFPALASDAEWSGHKWATVDVDDSGRIVAIELDSSLSPAFAAALRHEIATWAFEPARIDGAAVASRTHLGLHLQARERADGRAGVELVSVGNGPRLVDKKRMRYPSEALRRSIHGTVILTLTVAPDGSVAEIVADDEAHPVLRRAALRSGRDWRFEPEQVAGQPVATRIRAPVVFCLLSEPQHCPVAVRGDAGAPVRHPDELTALDSPLHLKTDPAGRLIGG